MNHNNFILSPTSNILKDMMSAISGIENNIETFPLFDYVMQSTFLKMTGSQEQKMKCIVWELATYDYEYRYSKFTKKQLGECSNYREKQEIYLEIQEQIRKQSGIEDFDINVIDKQKILKQTEQTVKNIFLNTNLSVWATRSYNEYNSIWGKISINYFATKSNLFVSSDNISGKPTDTLTKMYEHMYVHRNRIAHNTLSYQQNLPTLNMLIKEDHKFNNYFIYFSILILIDEVIMSLYKQYLEVL